MKVFKHEKRFLIICSLLFIFMFTGLSVHASAGLKQKANGTYCYYKNGKLKKNCWIKANGKVYYAGKNGILYSGKIYKIGEDYYYFDKNAVRKTGHIKFKKKNYYFSVKDGKMLRNRWIHVDHKYYFMQKNGVMAKSQWIDNYYVNKDGIRVYNIWIGKRYLGKNGKALSGLHKIGNYYYYFNKTTYKREIDTTVTVNGFTYNFDHQGHGTVASANKIKTPKVRVESSYYSDPNLPDRDLLAAIIQCESGDQSYEGQLAVGMVVLNRVHHSSFGNTIREVIYEKSQFSPVTEGSFRKKLNNKDLISASCYKAADEVLSKYAHYKQGDKVYLKIKGKNINFSSYLYFLPHYSYNSMGLSAPKRTIGDHVFFSKWY